MARVASARLPAEVLPVQTARQRWRPPPAFLPELAPGPPAEPAPEPVGSRPRELEVALPRPPAGPEAPRLKRQAREQWVQPRPGPEQLPLQERASAELQ